MLKKLAIKALSFNRKIIEKLEAVLINNPEHDKDFSLVNKNRDLVNKYKDETCYLVGCGPSLAKQDLLKLKGKNVIGLSTFFNHDNYDKLNIIADVFTGYTFHKDVDPDYDYVKLYNDIQKYSKGLVFLHEQDHDFIVKNNLFSSREKIRFYKTRPDIKNILKIKPSIDTKIYAGQNIAVFGIQIAMAMGFKKIYLLGLDHDWIYKLQNREHTKFTSSKNSDENTEGKRDFDVSGQEKFSFWLEVYRILWSNYNYLKKYSEINNISIINITEGGVLDVFKRENFEDVVSATE